MQSARLLFRPRPPIRVQNLLKSMKLYTIYSLISISLVHLCVLYTTVGPAAPRSARDHRECAVSAFSPFAHCELGAMPLPGLRVSHTHIPAIRTHTNTARIFTYTTQSKYIISVTATNNSYFYLLIFILCSRLLFYWMETIPCVVCARA